MYHTKKGLGYEFIIGCEAIPLPFFHATRSDRADSTNQSCLSETLEMLGNYICQSLDPASEVIRGSDSRRGL